MDMIKKGVTYDAVGTVKSCIFCRIISREEPATVVYEDAKFIVFKTIAPASKKHLLISPKEHIQNLRSLSGSDGVLVRDMIKVARVALGNDAEGAHYSFHVPPWNSIDHLHLHAIGMPSTMNFFAQLKYHEGSFWCANAEEVAERLENEAKNGPNGENGNNGKDSGRTKIPVKMNEIGPEKPDMPDKVSGRSHVESLEFSGRSHYTESKESRDDKVSTARTVDLN